MAFIKTTFITPYIIGSVRTILCIMCKFLAHIAFLYIASWLSHSYRITFRVHITLAGLTGIRMFSCFVIRLMTNITFSFEGLILKKVRIGHLSLLGFLLFLGFGLGYLLFFVAFLWTIACFMGMYFTIHARPFYRRSRTRKRFTFELNLSDRLAFI